MLYIAYLVALVGGMGNKMERLKCISIFWAETGSLEATG